MKRFAVVLLSVLLVLLPGCTKPVTESGTAESTAEALSSTESGAENTAEKAEQDVYKRQRPLCRSTAP